MSSHTQTEDSKRHSEYFQKFQEQSRFTLVGPLVSSNKVFDDPVIFVDGGSIAREGLKGVTVGDGDSSHIAMDITLNPEKDFSDLSFALGLLPKTAIEVVLEGFLGGRRDHELFNFGEVSQFLGKGNIPKFVRFDSEVVAVSAGHWLFELHGLFSLMAVETAKVEMKGNCKYAITPAQNVLPLSSFGLSNIGSGTISIYTNNPIFLLSENISEPTSGKTDDRSV
ncbi:MAG: hypothetical protein KTR18_01080 [Acidiferrobacterales bacterium]|nr:hypothetical protein [Acidiferrobacterales bacterium]